MLRRSIILLLLFLSLGVYAQPAWRIDKLGVEDGLSEGNIYVLYQDREGFIWVGTHGGLNRYDGYGFRVFQYTPFNFSTLGDNAVFFLKPDSTSGRFWIGGISCLNEFDPKTFTNTRYRYAKKQMEFADGVFISQTELLLACEHDVLLFDTRNRSFKEIPVYDEANKITSITRVENAMPDRNGNTMIMSRTGVFFYDWETKSCRRKTRNSPDFSAFNRLEVFNVIQDSRGDYWIATNKKGLIRYEIASGKISTVVLPQPFDIGAIRFDVVTEDSEGSIWAGSSAGLFLINPQTLEADFISLGTGENNTEPEINIILEDKNQLMWIGTVGAGIYKLIPVKSGFRNFKLSRNDSGLRTGTYIMSLRQKGDDIWFVNIWDQLGKVNMRDGSTVLVDKPVLPDDYGWYSEGAILDTDEGLVVLNGESRFDIHVNSAESTSIRSQAGNGLTHIYKDRNGKTWFMVKASVEETFARNDTIFGNQFFFDVAEDAHGNLWLGSNRGLIRFNRSENTFAHFQHDDNNVNSISSDLIYALEIDDAGENIWMAAYNGGLCSFQVNEGEFRHYTKEDGLADNTVYSIEKDHHGNFWFSSNAGISAYNSREKTFRNYTVTDGLLNHEFNRRSSFRNDDGWLFFGGIHGIDYFHPDSIVNRNTTSVLAFTNFRVVNTDIVPALTGDFPVVELRPEDRHVTVEYSSLNYSDQKKIQYAYRINDEGWIGMGNQHALSFSDLATGRHTLYLRSTNNEGVWLDNEIRCVIVVHPWWWQTGWFRVGIAMLAVISVVAAMRVYFQRKLDRQRSAMERQQAVEKERTRIATDMHDDLGADLSRIRFLSETIGIKRQKMEGIEDELTSIRQYSHDMIDKMGEIVWALNEKNDSLNDLLAYTRSFVVAYLAQNGIECKVNVPDDIPNHFVSGEFRRNVYLTVKEALHNIVKHSQANEVEVCVQTNGRLFISIHDNGTGFDLQNVRPFSNGFNNMKKRMESLGGTVNLKTEKGSTVELVIPLS